MGKGKVNACGRVCGLVWVCQMGKIASKKPAQQKGKVHSRSREWEESREGAELFL